MANKRKSDEVDRILKELRKKGFPFEVEISELMRKKEWLVKNQSIYIDEETRKYRTVDIVASKLVNLEPPINFTLILECKKSGKPWLFYVQPQESIAEFRKLIPLFQQRFALGEKEGNGDKLTHTLVKFITSHYEDSYLRNLATIPFEPFQGGKSMILEASMQVIKALNYYLKETQETINRLGLNLGEVFLPVIAFDGHLYSYTVDENESRLQRMNHILYNFDYVDRPFLIHIVAKEFLEHFLFTIDKEIVRMNTAFSKEISKSIP